MEMRLSVEFPEPSSRPSVGSPLAYSPPLSFSLLPFARSMSLSFSLTPPPYLPLSFSVSLLVSLLPPFPNRGLLMWVLAPIGQHPNARLIDEANLVGGRALATTRGVPPPYLTPP